MLYAQFYQKSAISDDLIEGCGDRAVIIIDARLSRQTIKDIAAKECSKRGYLAYSLNMGETFTRSAQITDIVRM